MLMDIFEKTDRHKRHIHTQTDIHKDKTCRHTHTDIQRDIETNRQRQTDRHKQTDRRTGTHADIRDKQTYRPI